MKSRAEQLLKIIFKMPQEVQFYFGVEKNNVLGDFLVDLSKKYNIEDKYLFDLINDYVLNNFNFQDLEDKFKKEFDFDNIKIKEMVIDYLGMIFLPIDKYLKQIDIKKEIKDRGGEVKDYNKYILRLDKAILDAGFKELDRIVKKVEKTIDKEYEAKCSIKLLEYNLVDILKEGFNSAVIKLNCGIIYLLFNKDGFKNEINKVLLNNNEKITNKKFIFDNKKCAPSVKNWLKYFINQNGSNNFNNIILSKFMTKSENIKSLDEYEKNLVKKLLLLYRNLKFFPDSLKNYAIGEWEIIPIDKKEKILKNRKAKIDGEIKSKKKIKEIEKISLKYDKKSLEKVVLMEEIKKENKIKELQREASKYSEYSLERKAINEEIKRMKK